LWLDGSKADSDVRNRATQRITGRFYDNLYSIILYYRLNYIILTLAL
jgi:hypothetical protein